MADEIAHVLFPNDAPAQSTPPAWRQSGQVAPASHLQQDGELPSAASVVFPNDAPGAAPAEQQKLGDEGDLSTKLFPTDAGDGDKKASDRFTNMMGDYRMSAFKDGDEARANELQQASTALLDDVRQSGGLASDLAEALGIVHAGMDRFGPATADEIEASRAKAMEALTAEYGGDSARMNADLASARRLIERMEQRAPGTMASLDYSGAGNDPRLIKMAIREAKRRGL